MEIGTYLQQELERIKQELKQRGKIERNIPLTEDEQTVAHLIAVYDTTKGLIE